MISETRVEQNIHEYLSAFTKNYQQKQIKKRQLKQLIDLAAKKIQKCFRKYFRKKQFRNALKLQRWWRKINKKMKLINYKLNKLKECYYKGIIIFFILKKFKGQQPQKIIQKNNRTYESIIKKLPKLIIIKSSLTAQIRYLANYIVYSKEKFKSQWKKYEEKLKRNLTKEIQKKWIRKSESIYIMDNGKEIDIEKYVNNQIQKIFSIFFEKQQSKQNQLSSAKIQLLSSLKLYNDFYQKGLLC